MLIVGISNFQIRVVSCDDECGMNVEELKKKIRQDKEKGLYPFFVAGTVGTTSTTAVDPIEDIGRICNQCCFWRY